MITKTNNPRHPHVPSPEYRFVKVVKISLYFVSWSSESRVDEALELLFFIMQSNLAHIENQTKNFNLIKDCGYIALFPHHLEILLKILQFGGSCLRLHF